MQNIGSRVINNPGKFYVSGLNTAVFSSLPDSWTAELLKSANRMSHG
jgi:hypothetical protein